MNSSTKEFQAEGCILYTLCENLCSREEEEKEKKEEEKTSTITTYGVVVYKGKKEIKRIEDITANKVAVEKLISICNEQGLSSCHIDDVVNDFLVELY